MDLIPSGLTVCLAAPVVLFVALALWVRTLPKDDDQSTEGLSVDEETYQRIQEAQRLRKLHGPPPEEVARKAEESRQRQLREEDQRLLSRQLLVSWTGTPDMPAASVSMQEHKGTVAIFSFQEGAPERHHWSLCRPEKSEPHLSFSPNWILSSGASFSILSHERDGTTARLGELTLRAGRVQLQIPRKLYELLRTPEGHILVQEGKQERCRIEAGTGLSGAWNVSTSQQLEQLEAEMVVLAAAVATRFQQSIRS